MTLEAWFRGLGFDDANAATYAGNFGRAAIADDEAQLPELGLTRDDLRQMGVKAGHFQTILDGIGDIERDGTSLADDRKDFVRRMIAVAVSVGFAGRLVKMDWISGKALIWPPSDNEKIELFRLAVGIFVVISGWEWYHRDVKDRPLNYPWRFYIDVAVVITTILFLFASDKEQAWLSSLILIFVLYVVWDIVSLLEFGRVAGAVRTSILSALITNVMWMLFFIFLFYDRGNKPLATCCFVALAAILLRGLGGLRVPSAVTIQGWLIRLSFLLSLVALYHYVVPRYWP